MVTQLLSNKGYILFNKAIARELGLHEAILLGELCAEYEYWKEHNELVDGKYFYSTAENIENNTTLSPKQQRTAIGILESNNIIETKLMGLPAKKHFSINESAIFQLLQNVTHSCDKTAKLDVTKLPTNNNKENNNKNNNKIGPDEPVISDTKTTECDVLVENKKEKETVGGRSAAKKRNYNVKPLVAVEEPKKLNRQQKKAIKIKEMLDMLPEYVSQDFANTLGEYLDMRMNLHIGKIDTNWFQKELDENILPALDKFSQEEIITSVKTVAIPKQYKRCFISCPPKKRNVFNDQNSYSAKELEEGIRQGDLSVEEAKRNGTYQREF